MQYLHLYDFLDVLYYISIFLYLPLFVGQYVPDQVRTLSQVGTKRSQKEAEQFWNFMSHVGTMTQVFVLKVIKRGFSSAVGSGLAPGLARLGVFLESLRKNQRSLMNLFDVNGKVPDLKRLHPTQSE